MKTLFLIPSKKNNIPKVKSLQITKNPFLLFAPFLLLYIFLIIKFHPDVTLGDQTRYLIYAKYMVTGSLPPNEPDFDILGNGPGYSLILAPFVALNLPLICINLLNSVFYYLSIVLLFKSLRQVVSYKPAIIFSIVWAIYPTLYEKLCFILPEVFTSLLISLLIFTTLKTFNSNNSKKAKRYLLFSGITFGYLALTKPIFGYVLACMFIVMALIWITKRKSINYKKGIGLLLIAFITTAPYLAYTYHLTGRVFYWSSVGGNNLYWMTSPYKDEFGSWLAYPLHPGRKESIPGSGELIISRHQKDFDEILRYKGVQQDDLFRKMAIRNIKSHPLQFLENCFSNVGRMLFNFPIAYETQKTGTLLRLPVNGTIIVLTLFCLVPTCINWRKIIFPIRFMLFLILLYLGGSVLGSADPRMFTVAVPILFLWIAYIIQRSIKLDIR